MEQKDVPNPYNHSNAAKKYESKQNFRAAEKEYRRAVETADELPLSEYRRHFEAALSAAAGNEDWRKHLEIDDVESLKKAYRELLSLPFLTRIQLAGFYARHGAVPEAREILEEALSIGIDPLLADDVELRAMEKRAKDLHRDVKDILGPENAESLFLKYFDRLDTDKNGFVDREELRRAQMDLALDAEAQEMVRYLLYHYYDVEAASNDEFGMEISGITKADVRNFQKQAKSGWKRMKKEE
ncbi:MAG TPA: EF-hand domain-containing protein [Candidatus Obscuribacterales bacterium]